jgi:hypothetical protein
MRFSRQLRDDSNARNNNSINPQFTEMTFPRKPAAIPYSTAHCAEWRMTMPKTNDAFTDEVLSLASDLMDEMLTILEESPAVKALSEAERKALMKCIADGFNDSTDE